MIKKYDFSSTVSLRNLMVDVLCGDIVILKDALEPGLIRQAVAKCHSWTNSTAESKNLPNLGDVSHLKSFLPARSVNRYIFNSLTFSMGAEKVMSAVPEVIPIFDLLLDVYNRLFHSEYNLFESYSGCRFYPQVIQYPRGGGFFSEHFHSILPQRIGLILAGSEYGKDYFSGGGRFRAPNGSWLETEGQHQIGDITLFRYDIGHDITPVDSDLDLDWTKADGRWTFILPLKPLK